MSLPNRHEITFTINEDGTTAINLSGYQGTSCLEASRRFQQELAAFGVQVDITQIIPKPELSLALHTQDVTQMLGEQLLSETGKEDA
jgi:hypothetical protein